MNLRRYWENLLLIFVLFLSRVLFISPLPIYFDGPEYIRLIQNPSLWSALVGGHEPIHPGFILPSWIFFHGSNLFFSISPVITTEVLASLFSALYLFLFYLLIKKILDKKLAIKSLAIVSLLPVLWLSGINVLTESTEIFFFMFSLFAFYKFINRGKISWGILGILFLGYAVFTHTSIIFWIPAFFAVLLALKKKNKKQLFKESIIFLGIGIILGVCSLLILLMSTGLQLNTSFNSLFAHGKDIITSDSLFLIIGRAARNLGITLLRDNSTLIILFTAINSLFLFRKDKRKLMFCLLWIFPVLLTSQYWHIGLFGRVSIISSFPIAILGSSQKSKLIFTILVINLLIVSIPLVLTNKSSPIQKHLQELYNLVPKNSVLISSNLIRPQVTHTGTTYFINEPGFDEKTIEQKVKEAFSKNKDVYIDSQALYNPYFSYDGNNLHILSLGKYGHSTIAPLFKMYRMEIVKVVDPKNRIYLYRILKDDKGKYKNINNRSIIRGKAKPGEEIFFFSSNRLNKNRMDYYDVGTQFWAFISNKREPSAWSIADKNGVFETPISFLH